MDDHFIPFALPAIEEDEIAEVIDSMRSGWVTTGPKVARFEKVFAETIGVKHALAVNSATAGLHLALEAVGVSTGDRVLTTPYTFTATAEVIRYLGADPIFVDIDSDTLNLNVDLARNAITHALSEGKRVKAIMPVHFAGLSCDMNSIVHLAKEYDLRIIEDAAHAFPATYQDKKIGSIGDATVFSFYATKTICTGEGGMVTTNDDDIAARIRVMRLHGINRDVWDRYSSDKPNWHYEVIAPGYKYNMTDIAAAMGIHQLAKADAFSQRRETIATRYSEAFSDLPVALPVKAANGNVHAWHLYVLRLQLERLSINRDQFIELMSTAGIGTSVHFIPLHLHPYWRDRYNFRPEDFPVANSVYQCVVSLPIYPKMTDADVERVIDMVRKILVQHSK